MGHLADILITVYSRPALSCVTEDVSGCDSVPNKGSPGTGHLEHPLFF